MLLVLVVFLWLRRRRHPEMFDSLIASREVALAIAEYDEGI